MGYFINTDLGYYVGDQISPQDQAVPQRPDATYEWSGNAWGQNSAMAAAAKAASTQASIDQLASLGSDSSMSRGLEDLVSLLIAKGTIAKTDLPSVLLTKIDNRRAARGQAVL